MEAVGPLGHLALVFRATTQPVVDANPLDHENLVVDDHIALRLSAELALAGIDPARLQRATQCPGQSTGCSSDDIVESRGVIWKLAGRSAVMLADLVVSTEDHRLGFDGQVRLADRAALANDPDSRDISRVRGH